MPDTNLFKYILIPFDGSASSRKAMDVGLGLAKALGARPALSR
jgi:nucleotide-binding universal stress UspA family protein